MKEAEAYRFAYQTVEAAEIEAEAVRSQLRDAETKCSEASKALRDAMIALLEACEN